MLSAARVEIRIGRLKTLVNPAWLHRKQNHLFALEASLVHFWPKLMTSRLFTAHAVDGSWSSWSAAGPCLAECGPGVALRTRRCDAPLTQNGGRVCARDGDGTYDVLYEPCNVRQCEAGESCEATEMSSTRTTRLLHKTLQAPASQSSTTRLRPLWRQNAFLASGHIEWCSRDPCSTATGGVCLYQDRGLSYKCGCVSGYTTLTNSDGLFVRCEGWWATCQI